MTMKVTVVLAVNRRRTTDSDAAPSCGLEL